MPLPIATPSVIFKVVSEGGVLLDTSSEVYYGLNEVGARIWQLLPPAATTLEELCAELGKSYPEVPSAVLQADVLELLDDLLAEGLLVAPRAESE